MLWVKDILKVKVTLPYKDFSITNTIIDEVFNTYDNSDYGYSLTCDLEHTNECKDKTTNFKYYLIEEKWRIMNLDINKDLQLLKKARN